VQFGHLCLVQLLVPLAEPQVDVGAFPGLGHACGHGRVAGRVQSGGQSRADAASGGHVGAEAGDGDPAAGQQAADGGSVGGRLDVAVTEDFRLPTRREEASGEPGATPGVEGVSPVAAWPGMPLWTRPLPLRACRVGLRGEWAEIQTRAGRPR
jgi:hypothetical protein